MKIFYITAILFFCVSVNAQLHIGAKSGVSRHAAARHSEIMK
jgi:hypothetical protein